jgi:hypothetical protein
MVVALRLRVLIGATILFAAGCAQQPVRSDPAAAPVAVSASPKSVEATSDDLTPELLDFARDNGYRPYVRNGQTVFCRREIPIGSSLPTTHCVDATNLRFEFEAQERQRRQMRQGAPMVGQPPGQ